MSTAHSSLPAVDLANVLRLDQTFLEIGQLPQCLAVSIRPGATGAGFVNLLTGQVVGRQTPTEKSEEGSRQKTEALLLSYVPLGAVDGQPSRGSLRLDANGAVAGVGATFCEA